MKLFFIHDSKFYCRDLKNLHEIDREYRIFRRVVLNFHVERSRLKMRVKKSIESQKRDLVAGDTTVHVERSFIPGL